MADISSVKLSSGDVYYIKDSEARKRLEWLLGKKTSQVEEDAVKPQDQRKDQD